MAVLPVPAHAAPWTRATARHGIDHRQSRCFAAARRHRAGQPGRPVRGTRDLRATPVPPCWLFRQREYATPVTSAFLHADLGHLFFNAFTFWVFAFAPERQMGSARFAALYALGLLVSSAGTYFKHWHDPGYRCLGASGAALAVLFAAIVYAPTSSIFILPIPVPIPAPLFALAHLPYSDYAARQAHGRVNHDAHLAGSLAGVAFVVLTDPAAVARAWRLVFGRCFDRGLG